MQGLAALVVAQISYCVAKTVRDIICIFDKWVYEEELFTGSFYGGRVKENSKIKGGMHLIAFLD